MPSVVIVEDEDLGARMLARLARRAGFEPLIAYNCAESIALFANPSAADAVILDLELPDGWGLDLLARLRKGRVAASALVMSAHCTAEIVDESYALGAQYVKKPGLGGEVKQFLDQIREEAFYPTEERINALAYRVDLTPAQRAVVAAACIDRHHATIAARLGIKIGTVKSHIQAILDKTGMDTLREVVELVRIEPVRRS